ncbi:MAG: carboxylating nicotinate-nucleotide diphosphorylase [Nitrospiria bacterium]
MTETFFLKGIVERALAEDLIYGDRTTEALFPNSLPAIGTVIAKEDLVVAGLDLFQTVFQTLDPTIVFEEKRSPGETVRKGDLIAQVSGDARILLKGERTALNFLQRLSGVATLTRRFVDRVRGTSARIVDTRKTTPGFRAFEKEAVRLGGGENHRFHLGDLILIKDNHVALAGGVDKAIKAVNAARSHPLKVEVEVNTLPEVEEALQEGVEIIMLDNMSLNEVKEAVRLVRGKAPAILLEVSGGIDLENVASIARCGVDLISVGALTHSAPAVDISLGITASSTSPEKELRKGAGEP